jgi:hypothetical protein
MGQDDPRLLKVASSVEKDLAFLERRAHAEGFQVSESLTQRHITTEQRKTLQGGSGHGPLTLSCPMRTVGAQGFFDRRAGRLRPLIPPSGSGQRVSLHIWLLQSSLSMEMKRF